jgi:hypothetical protein
MDPGLAGDEVDRDWLTARGNRLGNAQSRNGDAMLDVSRPDQQTHRLTQRYLDLSGVENELGGRDLNHPWFLFTASC